MKRVKINKDCLEIKWKSPTHEEFQSILERIKTLRNRVFDPERRMWICPNTKENREILTKLGFFVPKEDKTALIQPKKVELRIKNFPGILKELRHYQIEGINFIEQNKGRVLLADDMGLGKTIQALTWLYHNRKNDVFPAVIVCPASAKFVWEKEIAESLDEKPSRRIIHGRKSGFFHVSTDIVIVNYDILKDRLDEILRMNPKTLIGDEIHHCFPAGTKIATPTGDKNIEDIKDGDIVYNAAGTGIVKQILKRQTSKMAILHLSDGRRISATPNHPFFTEKGWISADKTEGKILFEQHMIFDIITYNNMSKTFNKGELDELLCLQKTINENPNGNEEKGSQKEKVSQKIRFLRKVLLSEMEDEYQGNTRKGTFSKSKIQNINSKQTQLQEQSSQGIKNVMEDEKNEPYEIFAYQKKSKSKTQRIRKYFYHSWRQWKTTSSTAINSTLPFRKRLDSGIPCEDKRKEWSLSNLLQGRYRKPEAKNLRRGGWRKTQIKEAKDTRQKEGWKASGVRVERVEVLELGNNEKSSENHFNNQVYNLEVEGHPSYFAEGILVHNCKNTTTQRTKAFIKLGKVCKHIIALSGTPLEIRPIELFPVINLLRPDIFPDHHKYGQEFCEGHHDGYGWRYTGASNIPKLHNILTSTFMIRRKKTEVLKELPSKQRAIVPFEIDNRKDYESIEEDVISWILENESYHKAVKASRAEEFVKTRKLMSAAFLGKEKGIIKWIEDFLETDEKLVIFFATHYALDSVYEKFKDIAVRIDGRVPASERGGIVRAFQENKKIKLFCGEIVSAGQAITLTASSNVAFTEYLFNPAKHVQAEDRCHRMGQKDSVTIHYLVATDTIEEVMIKVLQKRMEITEGILDGRTSDSDIFEEVIAQIAQRKEKPNKFTRIRQRKLGEHKIASL